MGVGRPPLGDGEEPRQRGMTRRRRGARRRVVVHGAWRPGARADALTAALILITGLNYAPLLAPLLSPDLGTAESALTDAAVPIVGRYILHLYGVGTNRRHSRVYSTVLIVTLECKAALPLHAAISSSLA